MQRDDLYLWAFSSVMVLAGTWAVVPSTALDWLECHPGLASWTQALGSIAALAAAFLVARWQQVQADHQRSPEERQRGLALAILIRDDLATLTAKTHAMAEMTVDGRHVEFAQRLMVNIPPVIERFADQLFLLGPSGHDVLRTMSVIISNRSMLEHAIQSNQFPDDLPEFAKSLAGRVSRAAGKALASVDAYRDGLN